MKTCSKCKLSKALSEFYRDNQNKDKHSYWCKDCQNSANKKVAKSNPKRAQKYSRAWEKKNPERVREYTHRKVARRRGLTVAEVEKMRKKQKGVCLICGLPELSKALAIDHNHRTGEVRGLLCQKCNRALGLLDVDNFGELHLHMALKYLRKECR